MEIWKAIPNYEGYYEVSDQGRIRSLDRYVKCKSGIRKVTGAIKTLQYNYQGYQIVTLTKENNLRTFTVHQLVALAFIPNFIKGMELNHIDGIKDNNKLCNLELSNPSHNQLHAVKLGLSPKRGKSKYKNVSYIKNPRAKNRWAASIRYAGKSSFGWKTFFTEEEAAKYVDELLDSIGDTQRIRNFPKH